ncbi:uncharacterized protein LOC128965097 [Oppia nitens]|uniref:uncharacterized protein LOC128953461 n=1 Tax=Oppia nitens TaxID=1686743 RepID=UPI0023DA1CC6|nr:uncharacterized protein LOC128953461 [Oppia nitens]XP_054154967.1 uncharacterized protein LOC128953509 [Oppia nitens]XP_054155626.1 uncharacterized protein LOC128954084 [Oppia nitens]XP_054156643.1 uncharacterized protein LOC128955035 [Oppia nitens]XP_054157725.1 uncharacterized protein LOC128956068 [Oppia nitens]XP_054158544.1 uncharacterized protein LOC128956857 [Oppia nitens]XP_054161187.1 uncharacterized protein LOC128959273 [Oppia nitens]XP_054163948.1 uncharacterized protein LOC1289
MDFGSCLPTRGTSKSAGLDLYSNEDKMILPSQRKLVSTGLSIYMPNNSFGFIAPRSSLAVKGIDIGAGIVDFDYTGIVKVLVINNSKLAFNIAPGDRIAQLIVLPYKKVTPYIGYIPQTERGNGGFGSTNAI